MPSSEHNENTAEAVDPTSLSPRISITREQLVEGLKSYACTPENIKFVQKLSDDAFQHFINSSGSKLLTSNWRMPE